MFSPPDGCFSERSESLCHYEVWVSEQAELASYSQILLFCPYLVQIYPQASQGPLAPLFSQILINSPDIVQFLHLHVPEHFQCLKVSLKEKLCPQQISILGLSFASLF